MGDNLAICYVAQWIRIILSPIFFPVALLACDIYVREATLGDLGEL